MRDVDRIVWRRQREIRDAWWQCVPAVAALSSVVTLAIMVRHSSESDLIRDYQQVAFQSLTAEKLDEAELYFRKFTYLDEGNDLAKFGLALTAEKQDQIVRAMRLMEQLAPLEKLGYLPAHFWIAEKLAISEGAEDREDTHRKLEAIETHFRYILESRPDHVRTRHSLAELYLRKRQLDKAEEHLSEIADVSPMYRLRLAQLYTLQGEKALAETQGEEARDEFKAQLLEDPEDLDAQLNWASAEVFLENFEDAVRVLTNGLMRTKDERFPDALVATYIAWFDRTDEEDLWQRLDLLEKALKFGSGNPAVILRLQTFCDKQGPQADRAKEILEDTLASGNAPAIVHVILGAMFLHSGDLERAKMHLEQAHHALPPTAAVANNLAWTYAESDPPQLDRALELVNAAIELAPEKPEIRMTRGQILTRMKRYKEAITDLEFALKSFPELPQVHKSLAEAYENRGDTDLAEKHREMAEETEAKEPPDALE